MVDDILERKGVAAKGSCKLSTLIPSLDLAKHELALWNIIVKLVYCQRLWLATCKNKSSDYIDQVFYWP